VINKARQVFGRIPGVVLGGLVLALVLVPPVVRAATSEGPLRIDLSPATALMGTPFSFTVSGLKPGERVVIQGSTVDSKGRAWDSQAEFLASALGTVDLEKQAPASGSYSGPDIFGLLWSMKPPDKPGKRPPSFAADETNGWTVDFTATDSAGNTATARLLRVYQMPGQGLVRVPLREDGMAGFLYCPAKGGPFPGVIILGGAGGGLYEWLAQAVASNGFAALTLAYFNYADLPAELVEIPLEYFHKAAAWLKGRPEVRADRIGLAGGSKGGELALLLASRYDDFRAVVAWTPAAHSWEGHSQKYFAPDYKPVASWSLDGKPLPFVGFKVTPEDKEKELKGELRSYIELHHISLAQADPALVEQASIPVERIKAPLLLISGTLDQTWPADEFCREIVGRLGKARFPYEVKHVSNPDAGHMSFLPYLITANTAAINGGTDQANAAAGSRSWKELLDFLRRHLGK
jgi:dienelactone hydrolase